MMEPEAIAPLSGNTTQCRMEAPTTKPLTNSPNTGGKSIILDNSPPILLAIGHERNVLSQLKYPRNDYQ